MLLQVSPWGISHEDWGRFGNVPTEPTSTMKSFSCDRSEAGTVGHPEDPQESWAAAISDKQDCVSPATVPEIHWSLKSGPCTSLTQVLALIGINTEEWAVFNHGSPLQWSYLALSTLQKSVSILYFYDWLIMVVSHTYIEGKGQLVRVVSFYHVGSKDQI